MWHDKYIWLQGSEWTIQNRSLPGYPTIILTLRNGASQYSLVLDCNNNPGLYEMVNFLFSQQTKGNPTISEVIEFKQGDGDECFDFALDCWRAFSLCE